MAQGFRDGIADRFQTIPMAPLTVVAGQATADALLNLVRMVVLARMVVMAVTGLVIGRRVRTPRDCRVPASSAESRTRPLHGRGSGGFLSSATKVSVRGMPPTGKAI